jgi:hypothetical protein
MRKANSYLDAQYHTVTTARALLRAVQLICKDARTTKSVQATPSRLPPAEAAKIIQRFRVSA